MTLNAISLLHPTHCIALRPCHTTPGITVSAKGIKLLELRKGMCCFSLLCRLNFHCIHHMAISESSSCRYTPLLTVVVPLWKSYLLEGRKGQKLIVPSMTLAMKCSMNASTKH